MQPNVACVHPSWEDIYDAIDFGLRNLNTATFSISLSLSLIAINLLQSGPSKVPRWVVVGEAEKLQ